MDYEIVELPYATDFKSTFRTSWDNASNLRFYTIFLLSIILFYFNNFYKLLKIYLGLVYDILNYLLI